MGTIDLVVKKAETYYNCTTGDKHGRYRSWEHCYKCFHDARNNRPADSDYLSLQLAFYLSSWGMYRGSSFLLQKDYKIHVPVVEVLMKSEYDCLCGASCADLKRSEVQHKLSALIESITEEYKKIRLSVKGEEAPESLSATLITKVLMGTLGCVPAYDRYFVKGIKAYEVSTGNYNSDSLLKLVDFYEEHYDRLEEVRKKMKVYDLPYPQMKLLDMGFWQIGYEIDNEPN